MIFANKTKQKDITIVLIMGYKQIQRDKAETKARFPKKTLKASKKHGNVWWIKK
jgi:hypothetical protein